MLLIRKDVLGVRMSQRGRKWILRGQSLLYEMRLRRELTALLAKMSRMMATGVMACMSERVSCTRGDILKDDHLRGSSL